MKKLSIVVLGLLLASCGNPELDQIYVGKYTWGAEVHSFKPCNSQQSYWVSYNWAGMEMNTFYKMNSTASYQPMYIKFRGHLLNEKVDGFALDYDGLIRISEVQEYSFDIPVSCQ